MSIRFMFRTAGEYKVAEKLSRQELSQSTDRSLRALAFNATASIVGLAAKQLVLQMMQHNGVWAHLRQFLLSKLLQKPTLVTY